MLHRLEFCHDWRSCKFFSSCVNFRRKQRVSLQNLCENLLIYLVTHTFTQKLSNIYRFLTNFKSTDVSIFLKKRFFGKLSLTRVFGACLLGSQYCFVRYFSFSSNYFISSHYLFSLLGTEQLTCLKLTQY